MPQPETAVDGGELDIPEFYKRVYKLDDVVDVDYYLPGCPPAPDQVKAVLLGGASTRRAAAQGLGGRRLGACRLRRLPAHARTRRRSSTSTGRGRSCQDPERCLLEQGILCAGSATRSGCGVRCPNSGMPCRGCYGPLPDVVDQGAKFLSAVGSIIDSKDPEEIEQIIDGLPDFAGFAYRFGLPPRCCRGVYGT